MSDTDDLKSLLAKVDSEVLKRLIIEVAEDKAIASKSGYNRVNHRSSGGYDRIHNRHNR